MNLEEAKELVENQVELHPDLQPYLMEDGVMGPTLKHPLVFSLFHNSMFNDMVNKQYEQKREAIKLLEEEENYFPITFLYERPYRLEAFMEIEEFLSDEDYWTLMGQIWTDSENIWQNEDAWQDCLLTHREGRVEFMMEESEQTVYNTLPPVLTVYRGYSEPGRAEGLSWTLSENKARWFATRFTPEAFMVKGRVKREHVLAYFNCRDEDEIVVIPKWVTDREEFKV